MHASYHLQISGQFSDAYRWWRRAAKAGDLEGLFKMGFAVYKGGEGRIASHR